MQVELLHDMVCLNQWHHLHLLKDAGVGILVDLHWAASHSSTLPLMANVTAAKATRAPLAMTGIG